MATTWTLTNKGEWSRRKASNMQENDVIFMKNLKGLAKVIKIVPITEKTVEIVGIELDTNKPYVERKRANTMMIVYGLDNVTKKYW